MKVGDIIKSFDFPGRTDCYMIGEVAIVHEGYFKFKVIKQVIEGEVTERNVGSYFETAQQGHGLMDDFSPDFQRIVIVG